MTTGEIKRAIDDDQIEWLMPWRTKYNGGANGDKEDEMQFSEEPALALMLINRVVFLNSNWFEEDWPQKAKDAPCLCVNCSDVFAWGCDDAESLPYAQIETLYRMWRKDTEWGPAVWCMIQRKEMPQKPVEERIRKAGIWDLDALGLGQNVTEDRVQAEMKRVFGR